ncbi:hypothetical protein Peur_004179 [Populus x canadensis]
MVLKEFCNISHLKLSDSLPIMLDIQHVKGLEQHTHHPLMLDVQHVIGLEQYVELYDPLVLTRGEKNEDNIDLLVSSARPFKMLQMIESNNYIIKLPLNFDISYNFDMKDLVIYKTQKSIPNAFFETLTSLSLSLAQKEHINATLNAHVVFTRVVELQQIVVYELNNQI